MLYSKYPIVGGIVGYMVWLILLENDDMGQIVFRKDADGNNVFSPANIGNMMLVQMSFCLIVKNCLIFK